MKLTSECRCEAGLRLIISVLVKFPFMTINGIPCAFRFRLHISFLSFRSCESAYGSNKFSLVLNSVELNSILLIGFVSKYLHICLK